MALMIHSFILCFVFVTQIKHFINAHELSAKTARAIKKTKIQTLSLYTYIVHPDLHAHQHIIYLPILPIRPPPFFF